MSSAAYSTAPRSVSCWRPSGSTAVKPPSVLPDDTLIEIASVMDQGHTPVVLVMDGDGGFHGVITLSRVLAAIAAAAGQDSPLVRRRLERDVLRPTDDRG